MTFALLVMGPSAGRADPMTLTLDPHKTDIQWLLPAFPDNVSGSFRLREGVVRFDPSSGAANGSVRVDARSGQSGNRTRDRRMHEVLESARYPVIEFRPTRLEGYYLPEGSRDLRVTGILSLRGADHVVTLAVRVKTEKNVVTADVLLTVPYVAWGLKDPSMFIFRTGKTVELDIRAVGSLVVQGPPRE